MSNKAVLMSIRPEWCKKILSGEKTVEVRKMRPKMETSFKVYIYCTMTGSDKFFTDSLGRNVDEWNLWKYPKRLGRVIGEFTCCKIDTIQRMGIDNNFDYCYLSPNEFGNDDIAIEIRDIKKSCIPKHELNAYGKSAPELFAWHISDLKIYDQPRKLTDFLPNCRFGEDGECEYRRVYCEHQNYDYNPDGSVNVVCCDKRVQKAPQSWCYVEGLAER